LEDDFVANLLNVPGAVGVPVVKKKLAHEWMISFYEEFETLVFYNAELHPAFLQLIQFAQANNQATGFRREVVIQGFPLLCALRQEEKSLYIGTRRLSRELALMKLHDVAPVLMDQEIEKHFFKLKEHMEKISTVSSHQFPTEIEWVSFLNELPAYWKKEEWKDVDEEAKGILKQLVKKTGDYNSTTFEKISDWGLSLTAQYDLIRVHLLKFLALLPSLDHDKSGDEVKRNLLESLRRLKSDSELLTQNKKRGSRPLPLYLNFLFSLGAFVSGFLPARLLAAVVRHLVRMMARRFIAGESINTCHKPLRDLRHSHREATLDQLGELVVSSKEADEYFEKVLQLIHGMKQHIPKGEKNSAGILNAHVSIKVSALSHDFKPQAFDATYAKVAPRLKRILMEAEREEVFINVDAEHYHYRDLVLDIFGKVLLETPELRNFAQTGIVVQAYLRDGANHLQDVINLAMKRNLRMPIRLVKGAYWDAETIEGEAHQFTPPQFLNKEESDLHFRQLSYMALKNGDWIQLAVGSHNLQDHAFVEALRKLRFPNAPVIEHQCLHMTYEALSHGLANMGWPTRNYMPIGNLLVGMAYLVRRIMENSSQVGVLSIMRSHQKASGLISPVEVHLTKKQNHAIQFDSFVTQLKSDFNPVRPTRLFLDDERARLENELKLLDAELLSEQESWKNSSEIKVHCSSKPELILGTYKANTADEALRAVDEAIAGLMGSWWSKQSFCLYRVSIMLKAADLMLIRRDKLAALIMYEAGKTMTEALADVDEAIDFINYYARQEIQLQLSNQKISNRGVFGVIAPWNFPLAIPCGMTVAPLLAGNAVILKPAEQTPLIGCELYKLLIQAGVPKHVLYLLQGDGEVVGAPLVQHPRVAGIVFTGSKGVGQWIYREAGPKLVEHYHHHFPMQKKIITEMGGKNAIIVTNNCELDETISGILYAAFGHAGQKCSAASRVIVHREVKEALIQRLKEAVRDLKVGSALDASTSVNPLVSEADQARVRKIVEEAKDEVIRTHGKIHIDRSFEKLAGFCVGPTVLELPIHQARKKDSWAQREIFGPVIHIIEFESLIEAIELFNSTEYALTGGIYSQSQDDIDFLLRFLRSGNLYINRPNTGARVAIEPFGGFKLSGTGPKAGGSDYMMQFHYPLTHLEVQPHTGDWVQSSGYQLHVPKPSLISIAGRLARFSTFANEYLNQYELLMGAVNEKDKAELNEFVSWVKDNLPLYLNGRHLNHVIPGQLSYNDKSLVKEAGLFVVVSPRPSFKAICYLMGALALGSGISVAATTQESYATWKSILDLAWKAGFSKANLDIALVSGNDLKTLFHESGYSYCYAGHFNEYHQDLYRHIIDGDALKENMRLILSENDGQLLLTPASVLDQFVWVRSVAVNTMRHGAPLELNT
jgi:RHH-type proline utilization regulon transcriptional repressor/proline dehydrogenase/delta 1-pyrroline-5-carboxylate dehydrogenase